MSLARMIVVVHRRLKIHSTCSKAVNCIIPILTNKEINNDELKNFDTKKIVYKRLG